MVVLLVSLAVLLSAGGATAFYLLGATDGANSAHGTSTPTSEAPGGYASPSAEVSTPAPESSTDARFVRVGQCVKNDGAPNVPKLAITECAPQTYEVLARIEGTTSGRQDAVAKCSKVTGYTDWYFYNSDLDGLDFVLCLKLR